MLIAALTLAAMPPEPSLRHLLSPCIPEETRRATVEEIIASGEAWLGRCVRVTGRTAGKLLHAPADPSRMIGLDNSDALGLSLPANADVTVTVTGRLDSCARRRRAADADMRRTGSIILLAGGCHVRGAPVLVATAGQRVD
jgi:hypothetical protein